MSPLTNGVSAPAGNSLADLVEQLTARLQAGEDIDSVAIVAAHPEHADRLSGLLPALRAAAALGGSGDSSGDDPAPNAELGDFRIVRQVGRGGMGVVYEAEQLSLRRRVALKVLPFAATMDPKQLQRFRNEALAAASLHHEHIVPVHAVGCERGVHYYAMQFIDGHTLADMITARAVGEKPNPPAPFPKREGGDTTGPEISPPFPLREGGPGGLGSSPTKLVAALSTRTDLATGRAAFRQAAEWIAQAAEALEYAHSLGIVHRDIKPGNLLIDPAGKVWVADFGLARFGPDAGLTMSGDLLGTLRYMAPEQALARHGLADHRVDVYGLGCTLYELLAGKPAVGGKDKAEIIRHIAFEEPAALRKMDKAIPAELETITLKSLAKNPNERYATSGELAGDLRRYLDDKPITARPDGRVRRTARWVRRHRAQSIVYGLVPVVLLLIALGGGATWLWHRAAGALEGERAARAGEAEAQGLRSRVSYVHRVGLAQRAWADKDFLRARILLDGCDAELRDWEWRYLDRQCRQEILSMTESNWVERLAFTPDGTRLISETNDLSSETANVWDLSTGRVVDTMAGDILRSKTSPNGKWRARSGAVVTQPAERPSDFTVRVWDVEAGREAFVFKGHQGYVQQLAYSPDSRLLATASFSGGIKVWDLTTGKPTLDFTGHSGQSLDLRFRPGGQQFECLSTDGTYKAWDLAGGREVSSLVLGKTLRHVSFSPDGSRLAGVADDFNAVKVWDSATGQVVHTLKGHVVDVNTVTFSPDGRRLASGGHDKMIKIWDLATGTAVRTFVGHSQAVIPLVFHPDGRRLASGSKDRTIRIWDTAAPEEPRLLRGLGEWVLSVAVSPDGRWVVAGDDDGIVKVWDAGAGREVFSFRAHARTIWGVAFSPDGRLATTAIDQIKVWDLAARRAVLTLPIDVADVVTRATFSPDGRLLACAADPKMVKVWDSHTGREVAAIYHGSGVANVAFSPDGQRLAFTAGNAAKIWDLAANQEAMTLRGHAMGLFAITYSPDGVHLATGSYDDSAIIWDATTGRQVHQLKGHAGFVHDVAFSPNGRRLATGGHDQTASIWDVATGEEALSLPATATDAVSSIAFSPDGRRLVGACIGGPVHIWNTTAADITTAGPVEPPQRPEDFSPPQGWVVGFGGPEGDYVRGLAGDAAGNSFVLGTFMRTARFGTIQLNGAKPNVNAFLAKVDPTGRFVWAVIPAGGGVSLTNIAVDGAGNIFITGWFRQDVTFGDQTLKTRGGMDSFIAKYRGEDGKFVWVRQLGGTGDDWLTALAVDAQGNAFVAGGTGVKSRMIFDKKRAEMCGPDLTVMKFAADGEPLWTRSVAGTAGVLRALAVDAAGDLYAAGSFDGTVNFPTGPLACKSTGRDLVVAKLAGRDGTWIWARQIEGTGEAQACSAAVANGGPLYVAGAFSGAAEFGPNRLTSSGPANGFVCRFDPATGTVGWGRHFGTGDFADLLNAVGIDGGGNIHAVGTAGPKNAFIVNISPTGVVLESITVDAMNGPTSALGAHVDAAGNRYVGGFFSGGEAGFPQRLVKATSKMADGFILKLPPASDKPKAPDG